MRQNEIDRLSASIVPLELRSGKRRKGTATGFLYSRNSKTFLITNWHVVTGRNAEEPSRSADGLFNTDLTGKFLKKSGRAASISEEVTIDLPVNDQSGKGLGWLEHPSLGHRVDVAAIPLKLPADVANSQLNDEALFERYVLYVGDPVFVLGYPWGLKDPRNPLPIWKGGTVASIPGIPRGGLPRFLIDAKTTSGMSGAPVICRYQLDLPGNRIHNFDQSIDPVSGIVQYFCGVYSGRAKTMTVVEGEIESGEKQTSVVETDLGYVWRAELIDEIIDGGVQGSAV
jgi:hypothetical protein